MNSQTGRSPACNTHPWYIRNGNSYFISNSTL